MANPLVIGGVLTAIGVGAIGISVSGSCTIAHIDQITATTSIHIGAGSVCSAYSCQFDPTSITGGGVLESLSGDRAAWDTGGYPLRHASDIDDATFGYHNDPANPPLSSYLGSGSFFVGDGTDHAVGVTMSGDATLNNAGVLTLTPLSVEASNVAITNGSIFIGGGDGAAHEQSISGDASMSPAGALTLTTVNADVGTYGDATHLAQITVDAKGRITAIGEIVFNYAGEVLMADGITPPDPLTTEDQTDWLYEG